MRRQQIKKINNKLKNFDEELLSIINETSTGTKRANLSNAVIFLKKAIEELDNSVNQGRVNSSANGLN